MLAKRLPIEDLEHVLTHTKDLWEEVRGERVFITGGTGFFGKWLVETFLWANDQLKLGARMVVLSRNPEAFCQKTPHLADHPAVSFHVGDVRSFRYPEGRFSHVIHAATEASARLIAEDPLLMLTTVVDGTRRTLEMACECKATKFLLTSSGAVYGRQPPEITHVPEDYSGAPDPMDPRSVYGQGKRLAEHWCMLFARQHGIEAKIARGFAFVGPHLPLDLHFAIGNFIRDGLNGGPIVVQGDGTPYRSYLYAADLAIWLWTILFRGQSCRPYNVGSEEGIPIAEVSRIAAEAFQPAIALRICREPDAGKAAERYVPSVQRAALELGLRPSVTLREALRRTIDWYTSKTCLQKDAC